MSLINNRDGTQRVACLYAELLNMEQMETNATLSGRWSAQQGQCLAAGRNLAARSPLTERTWPLGYGTG